MSDFRFRQFSVTQDRTALKLGTDAVLLGAALTLPPKVSAALDVGTGCGVIALMVAQRLAAYSGDGTSPCITGIDIDGPSIEDAKANFSSSPWAAGLRALHVPLGEYRPEGPVDLIFSNPPFFENSLPNPDPRLSAARHSGSLSFRDIIIFAASNLSADGQLSLILPVAVLGDAVRLGASFGLKAFRTLLIRGNAGKSPSRAVLEMRPGSAARGIVPGHASFGALSGPELLTLMDGSRRTDEYSELTKEFYL